MGSGRIGGQRRSAPDHRDLLQRITTELLGWPADAMRAQWIPSDESDVFEVSAPGHLPRIVKIERPDYWCVRREEVAFPVLRARGFWEFPEIEHATTSLDDAPAHFTVMPKTEWRPWNDMWAEDPRLAIWAVERIGDFLRRLAGVDWRTVPGVVRPDERVGGFAGWFGRFFEPLMKDGALSEHDRARLDEVLDAMLQPPGGFGGWQFAQVLTDGRSTFVAIDWGNLGAYWPLHDLAAAICSLPKFGEDAPPVLRPVLLDAFTEGRGLDAAGEERLDQWLDLWVFFGRAAALHAGA